MKKSCASVLAAALAAACVPALCSGSACDQIYSCEALFADDDGNVYFFDLASLCNPINDYIKSSNNKTYRFNICGKAKSKCLPTWVGPDDEHVEYGVAVQFWDDPPPCNHTHPACVDTVTGQPTCCTSPCEVIGIGLPNIQPWDKNNPATGGINITHGSIPPDPLVVHNCPLDSKGETPSRQVTYHVECDMTQTTGKPVMVRAYEEPTCHYHMVIRAREGCGCVRNCYNRDCGSDGCGGWCNSNPEGACPNTQQCIEGVCCAPQCHNKDCGSDGCGGFCGNNNGTCPAGYSCQIKEQICQLNPSATSTSSLNPSASATISNTASATGTPSSRPSTQVQVKTKADGGAIAGSYFGGIATVIFAAGCFVVYRVWALKRSGREVSKHSLLDTSAAAPAVVGGTATAGGSSNPYAYGT